MDKIHLQPIPHESALLLKEKNILIIADLHIGIEIELQDSGIHVPSQTALMEQRLRKLLTTYAIHEIVLLGDVKHTIISSPRMERSDVRRFLDMLQSFGTIHIIPGNHDGNIRNFISPEIQVHPSDGFIIEHVGFVHGHRWPHEDIMQCDQIVIGHSHPTIMLTDRLGYKTFEPCWVRGKCVEGILRKRYPQAVHPSVMVMPAFNPLCGGNAINKEPLNGPFGSLIDMPNAEVYLLDGTLLGKLKDLG